MPDPTDRRVSRLSTRKKRVLVPGADGWELPGGRWRVLRYNGASEHPVGWWLIQQKDDDGDWFGVDGEWRTMREAIAEVEAWEAYERV